MFAAGSLFSSQTQNLGGQGGLPVSSPGMAQQAGFSQQPSLFGQPSANPNAQAGGLFGTMPSTFQSTPQTQNKQTAPPLFGNSLFGAPSSAGLMPAQQPIGLPAMQNNSLGGQQTFGSQPTTQSAFGAQSLITAQQNPTPSLFGGQTGFGTQPPGNQSSLFGSQQNSGFTQASNLTTSLATNLMSQSPPTQQLGQQSGSGGLFQAGFLGQTGQPPQPGSNNNSLFGQGQGQSNLLGQNSSGYGQTTPGLTQGTGAGLLGQTQQQGTGLFGSSTPSLFGSQPGTLQSPPKPGGINNPQTGQTGLFNAPTFGTGSTPGFGAPLTGAASATTPSLFSPTGSNFPLVVGSMPSSFTAGQGGFGTSLFGAQSSTGLAAQPSLGQAQGLGQGATGFGQVGMTSGFGGQQSPGFGTGGVGGTAWGVSTTGYGMNQPQQQKPFYPVKSKNQKIELKHYVKCITLLDENNAFSKNELRLRFLQSGGSISQPALQNQQKPQGTIGFDSKSGLNFLPTSNTSPTLFGAPSTFGQSSTQGAAGTALQSPNQGSLFGQISNSLFGSQPQLFGASTQAPTAISFPQTGSFGPGLCQSSPNPSQNTLLTPPWLNQQPFQSPSSMPSQDQIGSYLSMLLTNLVPKSENSLSQQPKTLTSSVSTQDTISQSYSSQGSSQQPESYATIY